ncbi:MAG: hypothetical protein BWZ10_02977 [candidate division BRC1 bacterium ADurb.BinA364]|nr:MAG: hypothetical protein BWZ10_02977 [candidate division BRC1 bacterium ADurb.BinA364]
MRAVPERKAQSAARAPGLAALFDREPAQNQRQRLAALLGRAVDAAFDPRLAAGGQLGQQPAGLAILALDPRLIDRPDKSESGEAERAARGPKALGVRRAPQQPCQPDQGQAQRGEQRRGRGRDPDGGGLAKNQEKERMKKRTQHAHSPRPESLERETTIERKLCRRCVFRQAAILALACALRAFRAGRRRRFRAASD